MNETTLNDHDRWIMSFYRNSEISGALFFGRIAASVPPGSLQNDLTQHFSDESKHSWLWTKAMSDLGFQPIRVKNAYQDAYLEEAGMPVNMMEILALTNAFEHRVIAQYAKHLRVPDLHPVIKNTISQIVEDEKWHVQWISEALKAMQTKYGLDKVQQKIRYYQQADKKVYSKAVAEHQDRIQHILDVNKAI